MSKVKESITLMVRITGESGERPITIGYDDIWTTDEKTWRFQTWIDFSKLYVCVQCRLLKDGSMSIKGIKSATCRIENFFWTAPSLCSPLRSRIVSYR